MHCLCDKYYQPFTAQYHIVDCVSWVPRELCWTEKHALGTEPVCIQGTYCILRTGVTSEEKRLQCSPPTGIKDQEMGRLRPDVRRNGTAPLGHLDELVSGILCPGFMQSRLKSQEFPQGRSRLRS